MSTTAKNQSQLTKPTDRTIRVERVFDAPRERVWNAYTDREQLAQWWARGNKMVIERYEFEKGGRYRFVEHSDHGAFGFEGEFREIVPMERLSMTFGWDGMPGHASVTTAEFVDLGDGRTKVVSTMEFTTPEERDGILKSGMEGGMNESYAALDALLARTR